MGADDEEALWHDTTIAREMRRRLDVDVRLVERCFQSLDSENLVALQDLHERNRRRAEDAYRQRDILEQMVHDTRQRVESLRQKATDAQSRGDEKESRQFLKEGDAYAETLSSIEESLRQADKKCVLIRQVVQRQEQQLRHIAAKIAPNKP